MYVDYTSAQTIATCDGSTIDCSSGYICPTIGDCEIYCNGTNCAGATLTCPLDGDCYIECTTASGCLFTIIDATQQNGNFELYCDDVNDINDNICTGINVQGSTLTSGHGTKFLVTCARDRNVCWDATINCAQGMNCEVDCHSKDKFPGSDGARLPCRGITIIGPTDYNLRVQCDENNACLGAIIHADKSSLLEVTCQDDWGCCALSIYCPMNRKQSKLCQITGHAFVATNLYLHDKSDQKQEL